MRNELAIYQNSLLSNIRKLKERLESLEIFERAIHWNTQSDKQDQSEPLRAFYDIGRDIEKFSQIIAEMRALHTKTEDNLTKPKAETTACPEAKHTEEATNCNTPPRDWGAIITFLRDMGDGFVQSPENSTEAEKYRKTADILQCLNDNNGSEAEKEAFFKEFEQTYLYYLNIGIKARQKIAKRAQNERERRANLQEWKNRPFYHKSTLDVFCIESGSPESDKNYIFSCLLDTLHVMPDLIEQDLSDNSRSRIAEICKLYLAFVDEQFSILEKEKGGKDE